MNQILKTKRRAAEFLQGKVLRVVWRHRAKEVGLEFEDGTRLFVDGHSNVTSNCRSPEAPPRIWNEPQGSYALRPDGKPNVGTKKVDSDRIRFASRRERHFRRLKWALQALAIPALAQRQLFPDRIAVADERARFRSLGLGCAWQLHNTANAVRARCIAAP